MEALRGNSALVSNTMICEVARLFSEGSRSEQKWITRYRIVDLLSLIDAVILHDVVYTLPARLGRQTVNLPLRSALISLGVVKELDTTTKHPALAKSIVTALSRVEDPVRVAGSADNIGQPIDFASQIQGQVEEFLMLRQENNSNPGQGCDLRQFPSSRVRLDDARDYFWGGGGSTEALEAETIEDCGHALIGWIEYQHSGAYEQCTSILRDMYYILAAEAFELPYWPQTSRHAFASKFPNYFDKRMLLQLYQRLSKAFKTTVTDVYDDHKEEIVYIPPFATLVFERARTLEEIPARILEIREEYAPLRSRIAELESQRADARTIGVRVKLRKRQRQLLDEVSCVFDSPNQLSLEGVIRYVPEVVGPALKPTDPTTYSADLLLLPAKQLVLWWRRRPIAKLFVLADRLRTTEDYPRLIARLFGDDILEVDQSSRARAIHKRRSFEKRALDE